MAAQLREGWSGVRDVLDTLAEAVTIRDVHGRIVFANYAAVEMMGFRSAEELIERGSERIMSEYIVRDEHGRPLTLADVPSMRMLQGAEGRPLLMRIVHRATGKLSWRQLKATPLHDESGELIAAVTVIEDVTAVKNAEMRMRMLAESGRILASSLDYQETLGNIANLAVPVLADWCAVDFIDEALRRERVVVAHQDPAKLQIAARARQFEPAELSPDDALAQVLATGKPQLYPVVTREMLEAGAQSPEHLQLLEELGIVSVMLVPMTVPARAIGVITLVTAESGRRLDEEDLELAEQLARRAAVAVENARLHTTIAQIAETLQRSLRPEDPPEVPGWEIASLYRPAGGEQRVDVGGDFYELFPAGDGWFAIIGDVTGKGVEAAALTALLRHGARFASRLDGQPSSILGQLDEALRRRAEPSLCTALCLRLHAHQVVFSSAGHPPALHLRTDGGVVEVPRPGPLLGAFADSSWPEEALAVAAGEMLLLYTDGVTEMPGGRERFGLERLKAVLTENRDLQPQALLDRLDSELEEFGVGARSDDVAVLVLRPVSRA